ncbi:MAG: hypothetical protein RLZZ292_489 [Bacteroidota bacterium]|jgi:predicted ATPase
MINLIKIKNYKSVADLELDLGRVNIFIGANGSGKSNILEGIGLGAAAMEDKLDDEFLFARGIRVTNPTWMKSGFDKESLEKSIQINLDSSKATLHIVDGKLYNSDFFHTFSRLSKNEAAARKKWINIKEKRWINIAEKDEMEFKGIEQVEKIIDEYMLSLYSQNLTIQPFLIYAPENTQLRNFQTEAQIKPLGIRGEGLFAHLAELYRNKRETFNKIKEQLQLLDWYDDFEIPTDLIFGERHLNIKDRFLEDGIAYFDQRSANEGFLYLLFYVTLFVSDKTPAFFAIDNVELALNPKLGAKLIQILTQLAKEHNKQVIFTTHNPAILDGLNLNDDEQRLFVIERNAFGHTKANRIEQKPASPDGKQLKLSEQFLRGYLGGLPDNF